MKKSVKFKKTNKPRSEKSLEHLSLGSKETQYLYQYDAGLLGSFDNKNPSKIAWTSFICTEFTSLCPKTGQPDFAKVFVNYIADKKMVESKSMKLYLFSFRNHGGFHEDCIQKICDDLVKLLNPKYIEVMGEFTPRGGIAIFPFCQWANQEPTFKALRENRLLNYAPGKYSLELNRIY